MGIVSILGSYFGGLNPACGAPNQILLFYCKTMTMKNNCYLLIVLKFIVQDDSVGLVGLGPGEGDAVHGAADLVHDGHGGRSCEGKEQPTTKTRC